MGSNYIATDATINPSIDCIHDSSIGYSADFSKNGEVDEWEYFDGIHTYGAWGGFLFGTNYANQKLGEEATIGRYNIFLPIDANVYYFVRIVMKINPAERNIKSHPLPTQAKLRWTTTQDSIWDESKETYFDIESDNKWHTYIINAGPEQFWQGDINNIRIWPFIDLGIDGDEFFIRAIDIFAIDSYACKNTLCEKYTEYSYPCPWIGLRATIESTSHEDDKLFNIAGGEELIININDYGNEIVKMKEVKNGNGRETANTIAKAISRTNIGGYSEVQVDYTEPGNSFKIYSGTIHENSSVVIVNNDLSKYLGFYASNDVNTSTYVAGETPVNGYSPLSSFKIKTHQAIGLLDNNEKTQLTFNPFQYSIEGGRRDWLSSSTGLTSIAIGQNDGEYGGQPIRTYYAIDNKGKTIVDFNHPFNASGRIKGLWLQATLDKPDYYKAGQEYVRKQDELSGARVMIVRPKRSGLLEVVYEWDVTDRDTNRSYDSELYSLTEESLRFDVDVFVNKGDMIAAWNINMYAGKSISGYEYDAQYHQVSFKPALGELFDPDRLYGDGSGGLLVYGHSEEPQKRLFLDIDLGHRYNIERVDMKGEALNTVLEYNIARCLDINWECDTFGLQHWTHHKRIDIPGDWWYQRPNTYYGIDNLSDGEYTVPDGLACDSFDLTYDWSPAYWNYEAGPGVIPTNPYYFWINGDEEWLAVWLHAAGYHTNQSVHDFDYDPIAIYLHFPYEKEKTIYKSKIYFKEKFNFRSFATSTYGGYYYNLGDADDYHYDLIPEYSLIALDNVDYYEGSPTYDMVADYLFKNPCTGHMISSPTSAVTYEWDPIYSDVIQDFSARSTYGQESGYFTYQTFQVDNSESWQTARRTDWQIIEHQWEPITCKGWRIYTDFHKSTKITEMELYCIAEDVGSNLSGGIEVRFSDYQDEWWPTESVQKSEEEVEIYIGDSPRYLTVELIPITETQYNDIVVYVKTEDLYAGEKGCEYVIYSDAAKTGVDNKGQLMEIKNVYGVPYDLYVDISVGKISDEGLLFYTPLNNAESIKNPVVGADSNYHKLDDYPLINQDYNCAINCHTFGLNNLVDGALAHYSYNDMSNWSEYGQLSHGVAIDFENLPSSSRTMVVLPALSRSRWWKIGLSDPDTTMNVREMRVYDNYGNLLDPEFYHDLDKTFTEGGVSERAPHLENISIVGSYYQLAGDQYITVDLGSQITLGRIELWHDGRSDYVNWQRTVIPYSGIDKYARMCLRAWKDNTGGYLQDVSYYEHEVQLHGLAHVDTGADDGNVTLNLDFGCLTDITEWSKKTNSNYPKDYTAGTWFNETSASGTVTSGTCEFPGYVEFNCRCHNVGYDRYYYDMREDSTEAYKLFQQIPFEITFAIDITNYYPGGRDGQGGSYTDMAPGLSVGAINGRRRTSQGYDRWFRGVQMFFDPQNSRFGLAVRVNTPYTIGYYEVSNPSDMTYTYTGGLSMNTMYYCKLTCYGGDNDHRDTDAILYRAEVWTDAIDGANRIVNLTRTTNIYWEADNIAIGGGALEPYSTQDLYPPTYGCGSVGGIVYDLKLTCDHDVKHYPFRDEEISEHEKASIRIPAGDMNYVRVKNTTELDVRDRKHTHDLWVKLRTLPDPGQRFTIMEQYDYDTLNSTKRGWRLALYNGTSYYRWEWWINEGINDGYSWSLKEYNGQTGYSRYVNHFNIVKDKWYFMTFTTGMQTGTTGFIRGSFFDISGRATFDSSYVSNPAILYDMPGGQDIFIGKDFDGWICEPRISRGYNDLSSDAGGERYSGSSHGYNSKWETPVRPYVRMYPFSFYVSDNNLFYGHYANVDSQYPVDNSTYLPYLYYDGDNEFAEKYNTYFAIDLGHRYNMDIVRRYGGTTDHLIDINANVIYSNVDTDDPYDAFMTEPEYEVDDSFEGWEGEELNEDRWYLTGNLKGNENKYLSMHDGRLRARADSNLSDGRFYSNYGIRGDFSIQVKVGKISTSNSNQWKGLLRVDLSDEVKDDYETESEQTYVIIQFRYYNGLKLLSTFRDGSTSYSSEISVSGNDFGMGIVREGHHFYTRYFVDGAWIEGDDRPVWDAQGKDVWRVHIGTVCESNYPTTILYYRDYKVNYADRLVKRSHAFDARWMAIEMLNGDGTTRSLKKLGMYSDITRYNCPDDFHYNSSWTDLGPSVTGYSTGDNVALGKITIGSSYVGTNLPERATDGVINNVRANAWLSDNDSEQWLLIDLEEEKEIYRVEMNHGYSTEDYDFIVTDYRIESSLDASSFTTRWTISNNSSWERTHDVADPFTARYIRIYITDYRADNTLYVKAEDGISYYEWRGACMREIEVYEYYGYGYVSSEEWPIVAINLRDQFYIQGHSLTGLYTESTYTDWDNSDSSWAWSDDIEQDPKKVSFSAFGVEPNYEQWAVLRRDTATYHNVSPTNIAPQSQANGIDYLKHALIESETKENPIEYPWWWSSNLSTISRDYTKPVAISISSLKIEYPDSSALDTVQFIEGSNWGVDSDFAFREGLSFRWYIEDIDKLDMTEGYVFFGGLDGTPLEAPIEYRWYMSTISGILDTGWTDLFLRPKDADEVIYSEADPLSVVRPEIPEYTQWQTFGLTFKGKGEAFYMNIDGNQITRNHFADSSKFDYGLYLTGPDYLECPISEIDLKACTIEFWLRPDYTFSGLDIYRRFKNRSLFHLCNVANDVFGFVINSDGFNLYYGNLATDTRSMVVTGSIAGAVDGLYHVAVAISSNGKNLAGDSSSIKLYINGGLMATNYDSWSYTDEKFFKFVMGGKAPLALIEHSSSLDTTSMNAVISNLRVYNYCRSDFTDSMNNTFSANGLDLVQASKMVEISQDNVTYYKVGDSELPFFYEKVPFGDTVQVYVRSIIPEDLTGKENRTSGIITSWDIGV